MISGDGLKIIGHRGWPRRFPDNTLEGFGAAAEVADMVETDIRRCGDRRLVLSHDAHIGSFEVAATTWSQLCTVDVGEGYGPVLLEQVLAALPGLPFNLEVKNHPLDGGFEPDHRVAVDAADMARPDDIITSFYWPSMDHVRKTHPNVATGLLVDQSGSLDDGIEHASNMGHATVNPHWSLVLEKPASIEEARRRGLQVLVWTVNDWTTAKDLLSVGVDGIITDDPGGLREALDSL